MSSFDRAKQMYQILILYLDYINCIGLKVISKWTFAEFIKSYVHCIDWTTEIMHGNRLVQFTKKNINDKGGDLNINRKGVLFFYLQNPQRSIGTLQKDIWLSKIKDWNFFYASW